MFKEARREGLNPGKNTEPETQAQRLAARVKRPDISSTTNRIAKLLDRLPERKRSCGCGG